MPEPVFSNPPDDLRGRMTALHLFVCLLGLSAAGLFGSTSCGGVEAHQAWERDVLEVQTLHDRNKYDEAEQRYRSLLEQADDPDQRRYVRLQLAKLALDRGNVQEAKSRYRSIWRETVEDAHGGRALDAHARLVRRTGDDRRANQLLAKLITRYPETSWAEQAAQKLATWHNDHGQLAELPETFERLHEEVGQTTVGDDLWYVLARAFAEASDPPTALLYFDRVIDEHPKGDRVDDAEWEAAQLHLARQEWGAAVDKLERVADRFIPSWFIGSYSSPHASKARYRLGFIHLTHLSDYETAIGHFEQYLDDFPANPRADDALLH